MPTPAIDTHQLGKQYAIGEKIRYRTLRDTLARAVRGRGRGRRGRRGRARPTIWALRDLNLRVDQGEVVGVIGRNGAGKSTLLKVLSRITEPTTGYADVYGRVGSLIEVGTGFHQELTGRENTYLNGAILGMSRREITRKFDEIVAFAGVEKFIDTPVKHYSSGMYLRLAFAVAAHLETDILLVDEVLAVGDLAFQRKCLGKMEDVANTGRTVLFVSHNMAAIASLCRRVIVLDDGQIVADDAPAAAIQRYSAALTAPHAPRAGRSVTFTDIQVGRPGDLLDGSTPLAAQCRLHLGRPFDWFALYCVIEDSGGGVVAVSRQDTPDILADAGAGAYAVTVDFPALWLRPGVYTLHFKLLSNDLADGSARFVSDAVAFTISGASAPELLRGYLAPEATWRAEPV